MSKSWISGLIGFLALAVLSCSDSKQELKKQQYKQHYEYENNQLSQTYQRETKPEIVEEPESYRDEYKGHRVDRNEEGEYEYEDRYDEGRENLEERTNIERNYPDWGYDEWYYWGWKKFSDENLAFIIEKAYIDTLKIQWHDTYFERDFLVLDIIFRTFTGIKNIDFYNGFYLTDNRTNKISRTGHHEGPELYEKLNSLKLRRHPDGGRYDTASVGSKRETTLSKTLVFYIGEENIIGRKFDPLANEIIFSPYLRRIVFLNYGKSKEKIEIFNLDNLNWQVKSYTRPVQPGQQSQDLNKLSDELPDEIFEYYESMVPSLKKEQISYAPFDLNDDGLEEVIIGEIDNPYFYGGSGGFSSVSIFRFREGMIWEEIFDITTINPELEFSGIKTNNYRDIKLKYLEREDRKLIEKSRIYKWNGRTYVAY